MMLTAEQSHRIATHRRLTPGERLVAPTPAARRWVRWWSAAPVLRKLGWTVREVIAYAPGFVIISGGRG